MAGKEVEVTLAVFIQVPGKQVMLRRKNRLVEITVGIGSEEVGDVQKTVRTVRVKIGRSISSMSRTLEPLV